jgi:DNA-binding MarR family transcriptional regulator
MPFDIDTTLGYVVNRTAVLLRQELQRRFRLSNQQLAAEEWALMGQLWKADGLPRQALADRTIKDQTTVTRLLDTLVRKGLVRRAQDPADRRVVQIWLTERGRLLEAQLAPLALALMADAARDIPAEDLATTLRTLARIQENLRGASDTAVGEPA